MSEAIKLAKILWLKDIISTQDYENVCYEDYARNLDDIKHFDYKRNLEKWKETNKERSLKEYGRYSDSRK